MNEQWIEVDRLAMEAQNGSQQAKEELYKEVVGLLEWALNKAVKRYTSLSKEDLRQELYLVFEKCIQYFDPELGAFSTFFINSIKLRLPEIYGETQLVRIKRTYITYRINQSKGKYVPPTAEEIFKKAKAKSYEFYNDEDKKQKEPLDYAEENEIKNIVRNALKFLPERDKEIVKTYYGIDTTPLILAQIGAKYGITRERVRQIINRSKRKLKLVLELYFKEGSI